MLTNLGERFYNPFFGSKAESSLFDIMDKPTIDTIKSSVESSIKNHEKRAILKKVEVLPSRKIDDNNGIGIRIWFESVNLPGQTFDVTVLLKRIR